MTTLWKGNFRIEVELTDPFWYSIDSFNFATIMHNLQNISYDWSLFTIPKWYILASRLHSERSWIAWLLMVLLQNCLHWSFFACVDLSRFINFLEHAFSVFSFMKDAFTATNFCKCVRNNVWLLLEYYLILVCCIEIDWKTLLMV